MAAQILTSLLSNPVALIAAVAPFISSYIQTRGAELQAEATHEESEMQKANAIANELSDTMDKLAFYNMEAMFGVVLRGSENQLNRLPLAQDQQTWEAYQQVLVAWNGSRTKHRAQAERYFGSDAEKLLISIQGDFETLERQVDAAYYMREESDYYIEENQNSNNCYVDKYFPVRDELLKKMTDLSKKMIALIQNRDIGIRRLRTS